MRTLTSRDKNNLVLVQEEPMGPGQIIEIPVTVNGLTKVSFPDIANLRNQSDQIIVIKKVRLITPAVLTDAPTLGMANAPLTELQKISLVLYCEQWEKAQLLPILTLNDMYTEGSGEPFKTNATRFDSWMNLDWNKCFLQYSNGTQIAGAPYAVCLYVEYVKMIKDPMTGDLMEIVGPA